MKFLRSKAPIAVLATAIALIATACGGIAQPQGWSTPLIDDGRVFYFPHSDELAAAALAPAGTASVEWTFPNDSLPDEKDIDISAVYGDVLEIDGILYMAGWEGEVYAVNATTGRLTWTTRDRVDLTGSIVAGLTAYGDRLFVATTEGHLYVLNRADGSKADGWPEDGIEFPKGIWATPVLRGEILYVATMNGEVHAIRAADGTSAWAVPYKADTGAIAEIALLDDSVLFVPTVGKRVYLIDPNTGLEAYPTITTKDWVWTRPAVDGSVVYFGDFSGTMHAVDITTGQHIWEVSTDNKIKAAPAIVGDTVVVADRGPAVTFLDKATGAQRGNRIPLANAGTVRANVVANGNVAFILTTNGKLFRAEPERLAVVEVPVAGVP